MSREIKFRAWNNGIMCYVEKILDFKGSMHLILDNPDIDFFGNHYGANTDWAELMQYTGLKDKNDKEIYEDDIVKIDGFDDDELNEHFLVKFENESARYILSGNRLVYDFDNTYANECEIIGNIYENPELLEGDK